jgi:hypothetical protein
VPLVHILTIRRTPDHDKEDQAKTEQPVETTEPETAPETVPEKTEPKTEAAPATTESAAVSELKESVKADSAPTAEKEGTVDEAVEKAQASKAGQLGQVEDSDAAGAGKTRVNSFAIITNH